MSEKKHQPESEQKQLCVSCLAPNEPAAHFCAKCGAPLTPYASTGPFESLLSEGAVYRQAAEKPRSFIVVLGVWLIFGAIAATGFALVGMGRDSGFVFQIIGAFMLAVSIVMIVKTTKNYFAERRKTASRGK